LPASGDVLSIAAVQVQQWKCAAMPETDFAAERMIGPERMLLTKRVVRLRPQELNIGSFQVSFEKRKNYRFYLSDIIIRCLIRASYS
jgi:hypothetical protein